MKIGIVGLGLMGGSIAKSLYKNHNICAYDINSDAIDYAINHQIIHQGFTDISPFLKQANIIYLCLYPRNIINFIAKNKDSFEPGTLLIDISGTKTELMTEITPMINDNFDIVFTHPIAGREKKGVYHADDRIFLGANYIIIPTSTNKSRHIRTVETLAKEMGFSRITHSSMKAHDHIIAYTSQLTHAISLALVNSDDNEFDTARYIGDSYRDLTRISMINETLWSELFLENKVALTEKIDSFINEMNELKAAIQNDDKTSLEEKMCQARKRRSEMEG